ncbi:MAG: DUF1566 domain-containing protein [Nitrospirae bacterium]|nr:DUF1566 domain-containing protein [Nitrospirota bacterium]
MTRQRQSVLIAVILLLFSFASLSYAFTLPDTGEDGAHILNPMNYTDNKNGTVTDNNTGLMWQQTEGGQMTSTNALSYCNSLNLGGKSDWRLPNIKELESITNYTKWNPAINITYLPYVLTSYVGYWASTTCVDGTENSAWYVSEMSGRVADEFKPRSLNVRCVRGEQSSGKVVLTTDTATFDAAATGSITHTLSAPSTTTVSPGGTVGPITSTITNNSSSSNSIYLYAAVYTPTGSFVDTVLLPITLSANQTLSNTDILRWIPPMADTGNYYFCEYLYDTSWNLIDSKYVSFTVTSGGSGGGPDAQVVNNLASGTFTDAKIGSVSLPPPSGWSYYCSGGCSSAFYAVATGTNTITISGISYGSLGSFNNNTFYAVNIRDGGCAELWIRTDVNTVFNSDTTRTFVADNGKCSR